MKGDFFIKKGHDDIEISPHLMTLKTFKKVWTSDKDRNKRLATAELLYIYYMVDHKSPYVDENPEERERLIVAELELNELGGKYGNNKNPWSPDDVLKAAMEEYKKRLITPAITALMAAKDGLQMTGKLMHRLRESLELKIDYEEFDLATVKEITQEIKLFYELTEKLPTALKSIEALHERVKKQEQEQGSIYGQTEIGRFET